MQSTGHHPIVPSGGGFRHEAGVLLPLQAAEEVYPPAL